MIRAIRLNGWLAAVAAAAFALIPLSALRAVDRTAEAEAILDKTADLVDLRGTDAVPFLLKARVRLTEGAKSVDGVFAMSWAAPDRFRRVIGFPDYKETDIARGENYYSKRNTEGIPLMIWQLGGLMDSLELRKALQSGAKIKRVENDSVGGKAATCIWIGRGKGDSKICVDAATGEIDLMETGLDGPAQTQMRYEFGDYRAFGVKKIPWRFASSGWDKRSIEVTIEKIVPVRAFAADEFSPQAGSVTSRLCTGTEKLEGHMDPMFGEAIPVGFDGLDVDIYFEISPLGAAKSAQIVYSSDPKANKEILRWFLGANFPVKTCDGRPIGYQTLYHYGDRR
jgi:hypothetical protein